ncbi:hypothetical protein ACHAXA_006726 [Cyclostephanos tholiformis]|uniref:Uncharacterized protein n=1 Tax=Cyclostephanos tholiformis TaxID=382380 RepID=A0ABD3SS39_9STRA
MCVIATVTTQLWCFPERVQVQVIPRFKIVDVAFSLGPRSVPSAAWLIMLLGIILAITGGALGGCGSCAEEDYYYYSYTKCGNPGSCAMMHHYIYLDVKTSPKYVCGNGGIKRHTFRFKKMGFDHATNKQATFDQYYLVEYVYGSLAHAGNVVTNEAHLLSHFNHAALCTPIVPIHADDTVNGNVVLPNILQRRNPFVPIHADNTAGGHAAPSIIQHRNDHSVVRKSMDV